MAATLVARLMEQYWRGDKPAGRQPDISVVIPVGPDETEDTVCSAIDSVVAQDYNGSVETIAVCNGCPYETTRTAKEKADYVLEENEALGYSGARNRGLKGATGDVIVFLDADNKMEDNQMLSKIARNIRNGYVGGTTKLVPDTTENGETAYYGWNSFFSKWLARLSNVPIIGKYMPATGNGFIYCRADAIKRGLRFDENLQNHEDVEFIRQMRNHGSIGFLEDSYVKTSARRFRKDGAFLSWAKGIMGYFKYSKNIKENSETQEYSPDARALELAPVDS